MKCYNCLFNKILINYKIDMKNVDKFQEMYNDILNKLKDLDAELLKEITTLSATKIKNLNSSISFLTLSLPILICLFTTVSGAYMNLSYSSLKIDYFWVLAIIYFICLIFFIFYVFYYFYKNNESQKQIEKWTVISEICKNLLNNKDK